MGNRRNRRGVVVDGMLLLDKPAGMSSNAALQIAKRLLNAQKAGHTGSLDPIATGLLPLCFGKATKVSEMFLNFDKTYEVTLKLGFKTDTGDKEGTVIESSPVRPSRDDVETALEPYHGEILQVPPMYSALKRNGQPLYKLARQGIEVEREPRKVTIYNIELVSLDGDTLKLHVSCSKGFYIRSLAMDLGDDLGCGAYVEELRRDSVGEFSIENAITLEQLEASGIGQDRQRLLISAYHALQHLPKVDLPENTVAFFCNGQAVQVVCQIHTGLARLYSPNDRFLGLGVLTPDGRVAPKKLFV